MTGAGKSQLKSKSSFCLTGLLSALLLSAVMSVTCTLSAQAQFGGAQPPPAGSGDTPAAVNPGDISGGAAAPSNAADAGPGTNNAVGTGHDRTVVRVFKQTAGRGSRMIQTLRPDTLSDDARSKIEGILGINMLSGEQAIDVTASDAQIEQIQAALAAYPQTSDNAGRKKITGDNPATGYPKAGRNSIYRFDNQLPTVATFSRYLVILGVVVATVFMALAAYSVVMGNPYGGARVIGAASGLLFLMAAYTIWKIVTMNTFGAMSPDTARAQNRSQQGLVQDAFVTRPLTPATPNAGANGGAGRGGVPVQPFGNAGN